MPDTGVLPRSASGSTAARRAAAHIDRLIAGIDAAVSRQVDAVLHAPAFQRLEATWRGLSLLVGVATQIRQARLRVLDVTWAEIGRDFDQAIEADQSNLFRLIYSDEIGMPGGQPTGLMVADYAVSHRTGAGSGVDDITILQGLASIGAAAFCPIILGVAPALLDLDRFAALGGGLSTASAFDGLPYARWRALRQREDTRFLGLVLPRILLRQTWRSDDRRRIDGFRYREDIGPDGQGLLWGNAAFAFAVAVLRRFDQSGWFADLRGVPQDRVAGGLVTEIPPYAFATDCHGIASQAPVEVRLSGLQEQVLSEAGLVPLSVAPYTAFPLFNTNASLHTPPRFDRIEATWNARISSMLQYVLCVSRFAHFLLVMIRDQVGGYVTASDVQRRLETWLNAYCLGSDGATDEMRAKFPLREAGIEVNEIPGRPGALSCVVRLQPHFQLDSIATSFRLVTDLASQRG
jgi:type VI secretion system protein ImpD